MYQLKDFIHFSVIYLCEAAHNLKRVESDLGPVCLPHVILFVCSDVPLLSHSEVQHQNQNKVSLNSHYCQKGIFFLVSGH